jgi:ABC-2 type transport system ATP-binding protein
MIQVEALVKRYGDRKALHGLTFEVAKGDIVGFLGPNGAGKSTTLRILAGCLARTSGHVTIGGIDPAVDENRARALIGYMPEGVPLYPEMRVAEYLRFRADLKGIARSKRRAALGDAMEKAQLIPVANVGIGTLSKGFRQRVGLADALLAKPPLLILDEPTAGLDPNQILEVRKVLLQLGAEHTVLISTHILSEVEAICKRAIVIHKGKLVAQGSLEEIRKGARPRRASLIVRAGEHDIQAILANVPDLRKVQVEPRDAATQRVELSWPKSVEDPACLVEYAVRVLVEAGVGVREVAATSSLEQVFAELTRSAELPNQDDGGAQPVQLQ